MHNPSDCVKEDCIICRPLREAADNGTMTKAEAQMIIGTGHTTNQLEAISEDMAASKMTRMAADTLLEFGEVKTK